jgi:hypothetical protein
VHRAYAILLILPAFAAIPACGDGSRWDTADEHTFQEAAAVYEQCRAIDLISSRIADDCATEGDFPGVDDADGEARIKQWIARDYLPIYDLAEIEAICVEEPPHGACGYLADCLHEYGLIWPEDWSDVPDTRLDNECGTYTVP